VVIDVQARAAVDSDAELTPADLLAWEAANGPFPDRCAVLMRSGWEDRWPSQARFSNADNHGGMHVPGFSRAAVERRAPMPQVLGIGVDTLSIDPGRDTRYEGHHVWAAADKWALECLANLS
jgi:kynurenine formamidase